MQDLITDIQQAPRDKKIVVFDLDGTLTESKVPLDADMVSLLGKLMRRHTVAVIGGGTFEQIEKQVGIESEQLLLLPLNGGALYQFRDGRWRKAYEKSLSGEQRKKIIDAITAVVQEVGVIPPKLYGEQIDDRGSQITFSALGQEAPLDEKTIWDREHAAEHHELAARLGARLPEMEVKATGLTSIDVTEKGIDKQFGIEQIIKILGVSKDDVLFVGDALGPDGNDTPALGAGVSCVQVRSIADTKQLIHSLNS